MKGGSAIIQPERVRTLNEQPVRDGNYVVYWMQASQRAECNHALEYAVQEANRLGQPLVGVFGLTDEFPEANLRHYAFMLEGLRQTQAALVRRGVQLAGGKKRSARAGRSRVGPQPWRVKYQNTLALRCTRTSVGVSFDGGPSP